MKLCNYYVIIVIIFQFYLEKYKEKEKKKQLQQQQQYQQQQRQQFLFYLMFLRVAPWRFFCSLMHKSWETSGSSSLMFLASVPACLLPWNLCTLILRSWLDRISRSTCHMNVIFFDGRQKVSATITNGATYNLP